MVEDASLDAVVRFYDNHPINEQQIMGALAARGIAPDSISEEHLQEFDQDHYGGVAALAQLAAAAGIARAHHVLDICSGMGGPARYLAHTHGSRVTGIDLTASRVEAATRLTALARLSDRVEFRCGNALALPFADASFDIVISQEAWAHIPDKARLVFEAVRVLKPGGKIAFTDIVHLGALSPDAAHRLREGMTFTDIENLETYATRLEDNNCTILQCTDLSSEWKRILRERLAMYRSLKDATIAKFGVEGYARYDAAYSFFVSLYEDGILGGVRYVAVRNGMLESAHDPRS